jgi:hypothetical protein
MTNHALESNGNFGLGYNFNLLKGSRGGSNPIKEAIGYAQKL